MAVIKPSTPFDRIQRKFAKSDEIYFKNRKADNATLSVRMKHPYSGGHSVAQEACREKFRQAQLATSTALADAETCATYAVAFKKQKKYMYLRDYVFAQEYAKLTAAAGGGE